MVVAAGNEVDMEYEKYECVNYIASTLNYGNVKPFSPFQVSYQSVGTESNNLAPW